MNILTEMDSLKKKCSIEGLHAPKAKVKKLTNNLYKENLLVRYRVSRGIQF